MFFFWKCAKTHVRQYMGQKLFRLRRAFVSSPTDNSCIRRCKEPLTPDEWQLYRICFLLHINSLFRLQVINFIFPVRQQLSYGLIMAFDELSSCFFPKSAFNWNCTGIGLYSRHTAVYVKVTCISMFWNFLFFIYLFILYYYLPVYMANKDVYICNNNSYLYWRAWFVIKSISQLYKLYVLPNWSMTECIVFHLHTSYFTFCLNRFSLFTFNESSLINSTLLQQTIQIISRK
jgi:hypothetical protein